MALPLCKRFRALLVGIDHYHPNRFFGGSYRSLRGCVADVRLTHDFLIHELAVPEERIHLLTASPGSSGLPSEPPELLPTYENLVAGLKNLAATAQPGDQVFFHYSGHGGQVPTHTPQVKEGGLDECLVPFDIGTGQARYLRDLELAALAQDIASDGRRLTVVLDCCHSGGGLRDAEIVTRGGGFVDRTPRLAATLAGTSWEELAGRWKGRAANTRYMELASGWLPQIDGVVLLAACRACERAHEHDFAGQFHGVFSYWLVDSLRRLGAKGTYRQLHDRVLAKVHSTFETQTPIFEGKTDRVVWQKESRQSWPAVRVLEVDIAGRRLLLGTGRSHGVGPGALFAITAAADAEKQKALVEVTDEVDSVIAWAQIVESSSGSLPETGDRADLVDVGAMRLRRTVRHLPGTLSSPRGRQLELKIRKSGFLNWTESDSAADFSVAAVGKEVVLEGLRGLPLVSLGEDPRVETIVSSLVHLAKYRNVQDLENPNPSSRLRGGLDLQLGRLSETWEPGDSVSAEEISPLGSPAVVGDGDWVCLTVRNRSPQRFNYVVLDLQPGWAIRQLVPSTSFSAFLTLERGAENRWPLRARHVPEARRPTGRPCRDILKVLATTGTTDFCWLELPRLGETCSISDVRNADSREDPLAALREIMLGEEPVSKALRPGSRLPGLSGLRLR